MTLRLPLMDLPSVLYVVHWSLTSSFWMTLCSLLCQIWCHNEWSQDQPLKLQTTLLFPAVKIIVDVLGWGCGGSQQDCLGLGHVWKQAQVLQAARFLSWISTDLSKLWQVSCHFWKPEPVPMPADTFEVCTSLHTWSVLGTGCCFRACARNYTQSNCSHVIVGLQFSGSWMPSVCNCWCILPPVCKRRGVLRGSFCNLPGGLLL